MATSRRYICPLQVTDPAGGAPDPVTFTFVAVARSGDWYNKLSGVGDYRDDYLKPMEKLKWLLHFKSPVGTPFMEDWEVGLSTLEHAQRQQTDGVPNDLLMVSNSGERTIRTTSNMFKPKVFSISVVPHTRIDVLCYSVQVFVIGLLLRMLCQVDTQLRSMLSSPGMILIRSISEV